MRIRAIRGSFRRRVWHPCHTHAALRIPSTEPIPSLFAQVLPQNSQKFLAENSLPQIAQMPTDVGGYGIPAIPTPPSEFFPQNHSKFVCASPPTEFTEYTEASGGEEPPTDAHRCTQMVRLRRVLPRNSQNTQKLLAEDILPQISQMHTDG